MTFAGLTVICSPLWIVPSFAKRLRLMKLTARIEFLHVLVLNQITFSFGSSIGWTNIPDIVHPVDPSLNEIGVLLLSL